MPTITTTDAALSTLIETDPITFSCAEDKTFAAVIRGDGGCLLEVNDSGDWVRSEGIRNGDTLRMQMTTASTSLTAQTAYLYAGDAVTTWEVTTSDGTDADSDAFLSATGITDPTISGAINTFVIALKAASLWTKMKAIYPFVGGSAGTHKYNLKNPADSDGAYRLTFSGSWTHDSNGVTPDGSTAYADTHLSPSSALSTTSASVGVYSRTNSSGGSQPYDMACSDGSDLKFTGVICKYSNGNFYAAIGSSTYPNQSGLSGAGLFSAVRRDGSTTYGYRNSTEHIAATDSVTLPTQTLYIGASNKGGTASYFSPKNLAFAYVADGLSGAEISDLYTAVQALQTTLSRQV